MHIEDARIGKTLRNPVSSTKKIILDALEDETVQIEGRPTSPVLPLVGSLNVPVSRKEEKDYE